MKLKIHFIGVGGSRCATNWISKCLGEHPEIYVSYPNELSFFSHPKKGKSNYELEGIKGYYKRFGGAGKKKAGEFSPTYFSDSKVPEVIKKNFPNVKILISLRNPVQRYHSEMEYFRNFQYMKCDEKEVIDNSLYYEKLSRYLKIFPKKNIKIVFVEDIKKDSLKFIQDIYEFLEVEKNFVPRDIDKRANPMSKAKYPVLEYYRQGFSKIIEFLKENNLGFIVNFFRFTRLNKVSWKIWEKNREPVEIKKLSEDEKEKLMKIFLPDIEKVEKLLGRDLSEWKS